jgi:hypothetical protein
MNRHQIRRGTGSLILVFGLQLFSGLQLCAQQPDFRAVAAAKAAAGQEARTHAGNLIPRANAAGNFITFDVPGAGTASFQGTVPSGITPVGAITGSYIDANNLTHGFLRTISGSYITFDVPGDVNGTYPSSISLAGAITGTYYDVNFVGHGFLRAINGTFTTFDAPGAVIGMIGTFPQSISLTGAITGYYYDANFVGHSCLRTRNGTLTAFDDPSVITSPLGAFPLGTFALGITLDGTIVGNYANADSSSYGFLRDGHGVFTTFQPPGNTAIFNSFSFGLNLYINPEGVITGAYFQTISGNPFGGNYQVFVRSRDGTFTTFAAATYSPCCIWSFPTGINLWGAITGSFNDGYTINHGFLRSPDGTLITFDAPGAGTGFNQGTVPLGISDVNEIMGFYKDANYVSHGFLFFPQLLPSASKIK